MTPGAGLRARLVQLRLGRLQAAVAAVEIGGADEALRAQVFVALVVGRGLLVADLRRAQGRARGILAVAQVRRIHLGQRLAGAHAVTGVDRTLRDLAGHPEGQARLDAGVHLAGVVARGGAGGRADGHRAHGAHGLGRDRLVAAGRQEREGRDRRGQDEPGPAGGARRRSGRARGRRRKLRHGVYQSGS